MESRRSQSSKLGTLKGSNAILCGVDETQFKHIQNCSTVKEPKMCFEQPIKAQPRGVDESWISVEKYLTEDVPRKLRSEHVKDVEDLLSLVFRATPSSIKDFINWVAEVQSHEDAYTSFTEENRKLLEYVLEMSL
ncbi:hypothetical protein LWI28_026733 [Acer negundo]|uniref:Phytochelatin synthase C-terminal domain-containing protein n=1 Tax=Acer negundo TaxID=4023 RepID=A0AAD5NU74_ACENE|nr:hypothetical protein LWI28_026733 [Acer negundo]